MNRFWGSSAAVAQDSSDDEVEETNVLPVDDGGVD